MKRWLTVLAGLFIAILAIAWLGTLVEDAQKNAKFSVMALPALRIGNVDPAALLNQIVRSDNVDGRVLGEIEKQGNRSNSATAYFVAARFEYEHKRYDPALKYMQRALEFAPDRGGLHAWYAMLLLESGQRAEAVAQSERAAQLEPGSADVQRILGLTYYDAGRLPEAVAAWERSLQLGPNESVQQYLAKAKREVAVEQKFTETASGHFVLRYEGGKPAETLTNDLLRTLERQYDNLSSDLGITPSASITVILYSNQQFSDVTQAPAWASALNDGKLRIPIGDVSTITPQVEAVLRHELTHSFVHAGVHHCPVWLDEGLAQLEEPKSVDGMAAQLGSQLLAPDAAALHELEGPFTVLSPTQAQMAYAKSLAATEYLRSRYGMEGLRQILKLMADGKPIEAALRELTTGGYAELEQDLKLHLEKKI
jgi:tetratricopeptide (TPR) repeat protein